MNLLFISHIPEDDSNGVWKKILSQVNSLRVLGYDVTLVNFSVAGHLKISNESDIIYERKIPHRYFFFHYLSGLINTKFDVIYVRKPHGGLYPLGFSRFLKKISTKGSNKIYMEIPTYPFRNESRGILGKLSSFIFDWQMKRSAKFIDKLFVIGDRVDDLYGIKAVNIVNGVDEGIIKSREVREPYQNGVIKFLGVANLTYWHGYDRLIKGIKNYNGDCSVFFTIVGDNEPEFSRLKNIVLDLGLNNIEFKGRMNSLEIDNLVKNIDICVDSLGRHRSNNNINSSIKSKEYTALGVPFILSHIDPAFENEPEFIFKCVANDDPIDVDLVIEWFKRLPEDMSEKQKDFALNNFTWQSIFKKIL